MGHLDQLDLSLKLSKAEESERARGPKRLARQLAEADSKRWVRVKAIETVIDQIERGMPERGFRSAPAAGEEQVAG